MKTIVQTIAVILVFSLQASGQINPIINLTWMHYYDSPNNYFQLSWDEPQSPHDQLIGYNVYRENELYRFQTETSLYNLETGSNCGEDFLLYGDDWGPFEAHVTAVYDPGAVESSYTETVTVLGSVIEVAEFKLQQLFVYPNPSNGILYISGEELHAIEIYSLTGEKLIEFPAQSQINVSDFSKGMYILKLISNDRILTRKIILK